LDQQHPSSPHSLGGCLVRVLWMAVGNLVLVLAALGIVQNRAGFSLGVMDVVFVVAALALPALRYVDIRFFEGKTSDNRPATMTDWYRYAAIVLGAALLVWIGAHWLS